MAGILKSKDMDMAGEANIKDKSLEVDKSTSYQDFIRDLRSKCGIDIQDKANWNNKMVIAINQRMGVKRYTNFPYPGAPDIPLPETDKLIKKSIPNLVLSAWSPKNMCKVRVQQGVQDTPDLKEKAKKAELAINMFLRSSDMDWFKKLLLAADNRKQYGHCIFKVYEKFKCRYVSKIIDLNDYEKEEVAVIRKLNTDELILLINEKLRLDLDYSDKDDKLILDNIINQIKSGDDIIEFEYPEYQSIPMVDVVDPTKITVPAYTTDINYATRIREEFFLPGHEIESLMADEIFIKKDLKDIPKWSGGHEDIIETQKARNEGITDNTGSTDLYRLEMISCWYKESENKQSYRKILTFFADVTDPEQALVQDIDFPFEFDGWLYEKDDNETKDKRYYSSRGIPEQIRAMQEIMERSINNKIIRDEMSNTPMWEVQSDSDIMDAHMHMTPGAKLPVRQLGTEIKQLNEYPKQDPNSTEIMSILKAYTEEYLAVSDQLFRNATNVGGGKTLGEIQVGIQQNAGPLNLDIISWNETLSRVYQKIFNILSERLGDSIWIDGNEIIREDFNFPADVRSNGDLEMANENLATQKAAMRLQIIMNPALQDIVNSEDRYNALKDWLEKDGVKDPDQFCTNPMEIAQTQIVQMQQQIQQMQQMMAGMQKESEKLIKDNQKAKEKQKEVSAEMDAQKEMSSNLEEYNANQIMKGVGNELFSR